MESDDPDKQSLQPNERGEKTPKRYKLKIVIILPKNQIE